MKIISLSNLYQYDFYISDIEICKITPKTIVKKHLYKDTPVSHFVYCHKGNAGYFNNALNLDITPGTLAYIPKNSTTYFYEDIEYEYTKLYFNIYDSQSNDDIVFSNTPVVYLKKIPNELLTLLSEICVFYALNNQTATVKYKSLLYSFLYELDIIMATKLQKTIHSLLSPALIYIQNNYMHNFSSKFLSEMCNISETYFRSLFKQEIGMSPTHYKKILRIRRACEMLLNTHSKIENISEYLGFNTVQYFSRTFKKIVGCSPNQYRTGNKHIQHLHENIAISLDQINVYTPNNK